MVNSSKRRSKLSKKAKTIITVVIVVPLAILLGILIYYLPKIIMYGKVLYALSDKEAQLVDTTLTMDQKLSDFDYMYDIVCLENPYKDLIEQEYGISYDDICARYRELIVNSKTDFEYFSYMACFLSVLPGEHNAMSIPNFRESVSSFLLTEVLANQEMRNYAYSWQEAFRDEVKEYREYGLYVFAYVDGQYIGLGVESPVIKFNNDFKGALLLSIDGEDPKDLCFDFLEMAEKD